MKPIRGRGVVFITDAVAEGIAAEQSLVILAELREVTVETELGPAVLLREVERVTRGART